MKLYKCDLSINGYELYCLFVVAKDYSSAKTKMIEYLENKINISEFDKDRYSEYVKKLEDNLLETIDEETVTEVDFII